MGRDCVHDVVVHTNVNTFSVPEHAFKTQPLPQVARSDRGIGRSFGPQSQAHPDRRRLSVAITNSVVWSTALIHAKHNVIVLS